MMTRSQDKPNNQARQLAGWCAYLSGAISVFGILFLALFFGGAGGIFGPLNDLAVVLHYVLLVPLALIAQRLAVPNDQPLKRWMIAYGMAGKLAIILLQILLLTGLMPFSQQIGLVSTAFLAVTVWFVAAPALMTREAFFPKNIVLNLLAGLYIGYPIWAFKVGRSLLAADAESGIRS